MIINIGTNDQNSANNVPALVYADALTKLIQGVHGKYPESQIIVMVKYILDDLGCEDFSDIAPVPLAWFLPNR